MNWFLHLFTSQLPFRKLIHYISIVYGNGGEDRDSYIRGWMGTGTISKLVVGIGVGMGIRVAGTVGDGYEYLSPCSSLLWRIVYIGTSRLGNEEHRLIYHLCYHLMLK